MDAAVGDLEHARSDRERGYHHWACFSAQQAAEKAVKAYIPTRYPNAHPSGTPGARYTDQEAGRLIAHAEAILALCQDLLSKV
jgi:HEPN domain-containing protein